MLLPYPIKHSVSRKVPPPPRKNFSIKPWYICQPNIELFGSNLELHEIIVNQPKTEPYN